MNILKNLIPANHPAASVEAPTHPARRRVRKVVASLVAAVSLTFGVVLGAPTAAQAATSYGTITACFQAPYYSNGYTYWGPDQYGTAIVEAYYNGVWNPRTTVGLNSDGCASMGVQTGLYWHMRVDETRYNQFRYVGTSPYAYVATTGRYWLGTTRLSMVRVG